MKIIYLSSGCSNAKFDYLTQKQMTKKIPQAQKYHRLLMEGMIANNIESLLAISTLPVNSTWTKQRIFKKEEEIENGIRFIYPKFINSVLLRNITRKKAAFKEIKQHMGDDTVIICDILNNALSSVAIKCRKKFGIPILGIVTDVPGLTSGSIKKQYSFIKRIYISFVERLNKRNMGKFDMYLFQTIDTNEIANKKNKPFIVLEGQCDSQMKDLHNSIDLKDTPRVVMYAGGIHKEYGIELLVKSFISADIKGTVLKIYGDGNYRNELMDISSRHDNVKYCGCVPNSIIVSEQLRATLLVNPRLSHETYVRYSFPSKTLESMASGTPLLTTRLPCIPKDYNDYIYFFDEENEESFKETLIQVLNNSKNELHNKGMLAKEFVLQKKNNVYQAKRLLDFIKKNINNVKKQQ